MKEIIIDTVLDGAKLLPFLFFTFLFIEYIEHRLSKKNKKVITSSGKFGPLIGGLLGIIPQCGFSVMATNLYVTRIVSLGTLVSIYLSTSDEMLPILLSEHTAWPVIIKILVIKFVIGIISGFIIDFALRKKQLKTKPNYDICEEEHCHCKGSILKSSIIHTLKILIFIMGISFILNCGMEFIGHDKLSELLLKDSLFGPFVTSLIGLIPNCGASVVITELYLNNAISLGATISGLLTGSGVALLVLFKMNKNMKENFSVLALVYGLGTISGIIIELIGMIF